MSYIFILNLLLVANGQDDSNFSIGLNTTDDMIDNIMKNDDMVRATNITSNEWPDTCYKCDHAKVACVICKTAPICVICYAAAVSVISFVSVIGVIGCCNCVNLCAGGSYYKKRKNESR